MSHKQAIQLRGKIIGVLLRDARQASGKSLKEVGEVLGVTGGRIGSFERGTRSPSLPELEVLAYFLEFPVDHFWNEDIVSEDSHPIENLQVDNLLAQRNRTIGAMLRQARSESTLSQRDLASRSGISATRIRRYETGESAVPLPELEQLLATLNYQVEDFSAKSGPVGDWIAQQQAIEQFLQLPKNLQEFVGAQDNRPYLEMARRLSGMSPERIRAVAEGLKELSL
jgi:transcriptional regulator with XRE-family HTH domain